MAYPKDCSFYMVRLREEPYSEAVHMIYAKDDAEAMRLYRAWLEGDSLALFRVGVVDPVGSYQSLPEWLLVD